MARGKAKTKKRKSCPSGRVYARGKKKGKCVPKRAKRVKVARGHRRGCYARTRDDAINKMDLMNKRKAEKEYQRAAEAQAEAAAAVRAEEAEEFTIHEYEHMDGFRRRGHRRGR